MQKKDLNILICTVILAFLYIFCANKYVTANTEQSDILDDYDVYTAKVLEIIQVTDEEYNIGIEASYGKLIEFKAEILSSNQRGQIVLAKQEISPFFAIQPPEISVGDKVLISQAFNSGVYDSTYADYYDMLEHVRTNGIWVLLAIFAVGVVFYGKSKGVFTLISLTLTCLSIFLVFIPAILNGFNIYFWSIQICIFIVSITLLIVNGLNLKSISAGIGCIGGVLFAGAITLIANKSLKITGMLDEQSIFLEMINPDKPIDLNAIIFSSIIIGAIGAIMDVSISIASSLKEIKDQNPQISQKQLYLSGVNIGRDIMGTMTNTLILAYIGSSLSIVLLLISNAGSMIYLVNTESIIVELLQSVIGSLGILITLPLTAIISSIAYTKNKD